MKIFWTTFVGNSLKMPQFDHIIFDLDGTLTDNTQGIKNSLKYALSQMHVDTYTDQMLEKFIGPPLQWGFQHLFGMDERHTKLAVEHFRTYYGDHGWHQNQPYEGILEMLSELDLLGIGMYIATSKLEKYARKIVEHFEIDKYILQLKGADYGGSKAGKTQMISSLLESRAIIPSERIAMVGDTVFDMEGGKNNGLTTVAVSYGFGKHEDLINTSPDEVADDVSELFDILSM